MLQGQSRECQNKTKQINTHNEVSLLKLGGAMNTARKEREDRRSLARAEHRMTVCVLLLSELSHDF